MGRRVYRLGQGTKMDEVDVDDLSIYGTTLTTENNLLA